MPETFSLPSRVSEPDMHHGTCVTHVPWCMLGSLPSTFLWSRWQTKLFRHSRCMRNLQFYISGKRPISEKHTARIFWDTFQMRVVSADIVARTIIWNMYAVVDILFRPLCHTKFLLIYDRLMLLFLFVLIWYNHGICIPDICWWIRKNGK